MLLASLDPGIDTSHEVIGARRLVVGAIVVSLLVCVAAACWLWILLDHRIQFTNRQIHLQTAAVAEHSNFVFDAVDSSLRGTVRDVREGRIHPETIYRSLRQRVSGNPNLRALNLVGRDGLVLASSWSDPPPSFRGQIDGGSDAALHVSNPAANAFDGHMAIELSRGVAGAPNGPPLAEPPDEHLPEQGTQQDAGPGAVMRVVAVVDNEFVAEFFSRVAVGKDARVGLFKLDGTRLGGTLDLALLSTARAPGATVLRELLDDGPDNNTAHGKTFASAQRINKLPLILVTSRDRGAVLAPWFEYLVGTLVSTLLVLGLITYVVHRLLRERRERLRAQVALESARRLESLGRLSGGIAHDFNNILAAILGFGDLLAQQVAPDSPQARHVQQVMRAGERGKRLVERILAFSSGASRSQVPVDIEVVVNEVLDLIAATASESVKFEASMQAHGAFALGDETQLFECVSNLCTNALHAMPHGGTLRIETTTFETLSARALSHGTLAPGRYARIAVGDNGQGMERDVIEHLFEPFFTTRGSNGGTGLGLAMVHGAVKEMNGVIDVRSQPGRGALFALHFPLVERPGPASQTAVASLPRGRGQVVMVVDDEAALVAMTEEILAGLGYEPAGFRDPALALEVLRKSPDRFDALLTDQVMPGLSGIDLVRALRVLRADIPILLASGFGGAQLEEQAREAGVSALLQKPVHREELARHLARLLAPR